jgi:hypothetical protein
MSSPIDQVADHKSGTVRGNHLAILLLLVPLVAFIFAIRSKGWSLPFEQGPLIKYSLIGAFAAYTLLFCLSHHRSPRDRQMATVFILLALFWCFVGVVFAGFSNAYFDKSEPVVFSSVVRDKHSSANWSPYRGGTTRVRTLKMNPWKGRNEDKWVRVSRKTYQANDVGAEVEVRVKAGYFGWEWLAGITPLSAGQQQ